MKDVLRDPSWDLLEDSPWGFFEDFLRDPSRGSSLNF